MILVIMKMTTLPAKRKEFLQTIQALVPAVRKFKGCIDCSACLDLENDDVFCVIHRWETQKELNIFLRSDLFDVLLGTKNFFIKPWKIDFKKVSSMTGIEVARNKIS